MKHFNERKGNITRTPFNKRKVTHTHINEKKANITMTHFNERKADITIALLRQIHRSYSVRTNQNLAETDLQIT